MSLQNLFTNIPEDLNKEVFESLVTGENLKIERIISYGHTSPESGWYQQNQNEWVVVLKGQAKILFEDGELAHLQVGDYLNIHSQRRHKVQWTLEKQQTIWLAVHYN